MRTIVVNQDSLLRIKEAVDKEQDIQGKKCYAVREAKPEMDEYEIGAECDNPLMGGNFYHINESVMGDISTINNIEVKAHDNAREECDDEEDIEFFEPYYEIDAYNVEGDNVLIWEPIYLSDLGDYFPQSVVTDIVEKNGKPTSDGCYRIEDILYRDTTPSDINDVDEVNSIAKKIQSGGPSGYLLVDGECIYFQDHYYINNIDGMTISKFLELGNIRFSESGVELIKCPTEAQIRVLRGLFNNSGGNTYLDIAEPSERSFYPSHVCSATYINANPNRIINDILRYFAEGLKPQGQSFYEGKEAESVNENYEFEVDSSDIDLSSFKKKKSLPTNIWDEDGKLNSKIRLRLLDIADDFWKYVNLTWVKPKGIILTGSICNFNWSSFSDIDLHLIADFNEIDEKTEFVKAYLDSKKNEWNDEHKGLQIMGFPIELYTQDINEMPQSNGIYDLEEDEWLQEPNPDEIKSIGLNKFSIKEKAAEIMTIIDNMYEDIASTDDTYKARTIGDDAQYLWDKVKNMRKKSLEKHGESGSGNIIYKVLRRSGYLDRLYHLSNVAYDKYNSIDENKEVIKEYLEKDHNFPLYKYFKWAKTASVEEKAEDLAWHCSHYIENYIREVTVYKGFDELLDKDGWFDYCDDEKIEQFISLLKRHDLCEHFISAMERIISGCGDYMDLPTWMSCDFIRVVKNEWCIHFGSDSMSIAREGFTGGTDDINSIAYTNAGHYKASEGYNFAYLLGERNVDNNEYGDEAVIFRTSGVEIYHYGDEENQVVFWGPNVKSFIPIRYDSNTYGQWVVLGKNDQVLKAADFPSEIAEWAVDNLPQYRKQIMTGKNGFIPMQRHYDTETNTVKKAPYPIYRNENVKHYLSLLKEEVVADGNSEHNPYKERWNAERKALKDFISNYGKIMTSKENGKTYKVYYDKTLSELIGYNYCICLQWDMVEMKPKSIIYIRALDKFTNRIFQSSFDTRGKDNEIGTSDDTK